MWAILFPILRDTQYKQKINNYKYHEYGAHSINT